MSAGRNLICVLTHGDGDTASLARSLRAVLAQPNAEVLLVDHAAQGLSTASLDPRVTVLRIAKAARATARNRALHVISKRADLEKMWVWVLEPGDTPAPFASRELSARIYVMDETNAAPDLVLLRGVVRRGQGAEAHPGQEALDLYDKAWEAHDTATLPQFDRHEAALVAPVSAMRLVRADLIRRLKLRFADDQEGGDLQFSTGAVLGAATIARCPMPVFARDDAPFAALSPARIRDATRALAVFGASAQINDPALRLALMAAIARDLVDRPMPPDPGAQAGLAGMLELMIARADRRVHWSLDAEARAPVERDLAAVAPWLATTMAAFSQLVPTKGNTPPQEQTAQGQTKLGP